MADREASMDPQTAHDQFVHVRIIIGIVTGLSVTRLRPALFLADLADSAIKGAQSIFNAFGIGYPIRQGSPPWRSSPRSSLTGAITASSSRSRSGPRSIGSRASSRCWSRSR
jgi:hypothetical protein